MPTARVGCRFRPQGGLYFVRRHTLPNQPDSVAIRRNRAAVTSRCRRFSSNDPLQFRFPILDIDRMFCPVHPFPPNFDAANHSSEEFVATWTEISARHNQSTPDQCRRPGAGSRPSFERSIMGQKFRKPARRTGRRANPVGSAAGKKDVTRAERFLIVSNAPR